MVQKNKQFSQKLMLLVLYDYWAIQLNGRRASILSSIGSKDPLK